MDVAIVGGGPAGLLAALRCAQAGLDVVVFEEHPVIGDPVHCTGIISVETAELAKVPDELVLKRLSRALLHAPGGEVHEVVWRDELGEPILVVDRGAFDRRLAADAVEAGAGIRTGARVSQVVAGEGGVELVTSWGAARARACVLAAGVTYRFQRRLGLGLPGRVAHTAQTEAHAGPGECVDVFFGRGVAPAGFGWVVPVSREGRDGVKVGVMAGGDARAALERLLARADVRARLAGEPGPAVRRLLPLRPIPRTFGDRMLVVGDAGGFTKPTTGGGIFYSLLTASLAAETLVEAFQRGRLDAGFLARYERRWQERLGQEFRVAAWLRDVAVRLDDDDLDVLLRAVTREELQAVIHRTARFNWHAEVIRALARDNGLAGILLRALIR